MKIPLPQRENLSADFTAGLTVSLVTIPEGAAYAVVANVNPIYGMYAGMLTMVIGSLTASSTLMIVTLSNAIALTAADALDLLPADMQLQGIVTLTLLVGLFQLAIGAVGLGKLTRLFSDEVLAGFVFAVAVALIFGQLSHLTGYKSTIVVGSIFTGSLLKAVDLALHPGQWDLATVALGIGTIALVLIFKRSRLKKLAYMLAIILSSSFLAVVRWPSVETIGNIATVPSGVPSFVLPSLTLVPTLAATALAVAIASLVESSGVTPTFPNPDGSRASSSRNFSAQGIANLIASFTGALPGGGSVTRTAVSVDSGATSRWAGIFGGFITLVVIALVGSLTEAIPLTALAGMLIVIGVELLIEKWPVFVRGWRVSKPYTIGGVITFMIGIEVDLTVAVFAGVILTVLLYIYYSARRVELYELVRRDDGRYEECASPARLPSNKATVIGLPGNEFYAAVGTLVQLLPSTKGTHDAVLILEMRGLRFVSTTLLDWVQKYTAQIDKSGNKLMLSEVDAHVFNELQRTGMSDTIGPENIFVAKPVIGASIDDALAAANTWIRRHQA
jgi:SulP family sulfate permease